MKIVYDLRILGPRMHGMARYGLELLKAMLATDTSVGVAVLVRHRDLAAWLPADERVLAVVCNLAPYGMGSQLLLTKVLATMLPDIYHCPFYAPPARFPGRTLMTIHDLIHLRFPQDHGLRHRLFYKHVVGPAARRAQAVFTVSRHSKEDVVELLGVDAVERIPKRPGEPDCTCADVTRIARDLGWSAEVSIEEGVARLLENLDYWRDAPVWSSGDIAIATADWFKHIKA